MEKILELLEFKNIEKNKTLIKQQVIMKKIKKNKDSIVHLKKNFFEKSIEILTFGLINFNQKYEIKISEIKFSLTNLERTFKQFQKHLIIITNEIKDYENMFEEKINEFREELLIFQDELVFTSKNQYINNYTRVKYFTKLENLIHHQNKFLHHSKVEKDINIVIDFYSNSKRWTENSNKAFVKREKNIEKEFFDTIESNPLTDKQQDAVLVNENNNLILAGAGSGKTSVIVAKVIYLIKKNILDSNEILVLAFNKNAQKELEERFTEKSVSIKVKTFHSFGLSIIAQEFSEKFNLCPMSESQNNMTKFIKDTIHNLMASKNSFLVNFLTFIAYFEIPYKSESEFETQGEYYDHLKSHDMKSLKHEVAERGRKNENLTTLKEETVKSHQELVIANFLTLNGIRYLYEEPYQYKTYTVEKGQYKPDFYLPDYNIYIEHFGIDRDNKTAPYINNVEYLQGIKWKVALHDEKKTVLVQTFSYEFTENNLLKKLKEKLLIQGVIFRELEFSEISELLKEPIENNKFTKLFSTFLNHYKSNMHNLDNLKDKKEAIEIERTHIFLKIFEFILNEYIKFQERNSCIDFDDMIVKALVSIDMNNYEHHFKHIFIDEFQDISTTRAKLIKALLPLNNTSLTAVGDDWQSINKFAGSNIKIIQEFEKTFGISQTVALDYTFRFNDSISKVASNFIQKNPYQIEKKIKTIKNQDLNKFSILLYWTTGDRMNDLESILILISKKEKMKEKQISVMVLARYNFIFSNLKGLKIKYPNLNIQFSTVHSSKGNEADYVVILDLDKGKFGFPSKIEDDPILNIVVPKGEDFIDAEERRLFYVALTRTKSTLFLMSDRYNTSPFVEELIADNKNDIFFLNDLKNKLESCPTCITGFLKKRIDSKNKKNHFYGCSNFPRCKYTENIHYCPMCQSQIMKNEKKKVAKCSNDSCDFETPLCLDCNRIMIERKGKYGDFLGCDNYPKCSYTKKLEYV